MATVSTFTRARPASSTSASAARDTTPTALGAVGAIVVTEDATADGGATVTVSDGAYAWTGSTGAPIDPRTGRPYRVAPWVPTWPTDLRALVTRRPLSAYISTPATLTYDALVAALASKLGAWGWTQTDDEV